METIKKTKADFENIFVSPYGPCFSVMGKYIKDNYYIATK